MLEQAGVAYSVYSDAASNNSSGLGALNDLIRINRKLGFAAKLCSKHYIPAFSIFEDMTLDGHEGGKASVLNSTDAYGVFYRHNVPLLMLWPATQISVTNSKYTKEQYSKVHEAFNCVNKYYEKNKLK